MATLLGYIFSNNEKMVSQCNDEILAETLVIQLDQERYEQILSEGGASPTNMRKHKKISVARFTLATARNQVSDETKKATCRPNSVSVKTEPASRQHFYALCEAKCNPQCHMYVCRYWYPVPI